MGVRVVILGSTGSIGTQTVEVIEHLNALHGRGLTLHRFEIVGLAAGSNAGLVAEQARRLRVPAVAICENGEDPGLPAGTRVLRGAGAAEELVRGVECDLVVAAMVGFVGLPATRAAVELGRRVALANKETLVAAGAIVIPACGRSGARLLPVDSEHAGLWQCMEGDKRQATSDTTPPCECDERVRRATITASGGPFRTWTKEQIEKATPEQAMKHPTWSMGPKVTIDSASLMNKAMELIEAHWLFGLAAEQLHVLVHPQSLVHAMVEFVDGSVVAQMAAPDMRTPIQRALTWPLCVPGISRTIDWASLKGLEFEEPDLARFPALALGHRVVREGGTSGAVLNGANEAAVEAFVAGRIGFGDIARLVERAMDKIAVRPVRSFEDVREVDAEARARVKEWIGDSGRS